MAKPTLKFKIALSLLLICGFFTLETYASEICTHHLRNQAIRTYSRSFRVFFRDLAIRQTLNLWPGRSYADIKSSGTANDFRIQTLILAKDHVFSNGREIEISAAIDFITPPKKTDQASSQKRQLSLNFNPVEEKRTRVKRTLYLTVESSTGTKGKPLELEWDGTQSFNAVIALENRFYELTADLTVSGETLASDRLYLEPLQVQKLTLRLTEVK